MPLEDSPTSTPTGVAPGIGGGRYRLVAKLGEGGMAAVYRGWDVERREWCAVKVLLPDYARRRKLRQRFENEAVLMSRIDHRHVISVFDVGTDEALPYIVMELAEGGSLIDWNERYGPMPARLAVDVAMQICKGIGAAHELGVVHRDVKPHNVLVTHRGVCKVTDFGIAQIDDAASMTRTGSVMGTLGYMAPEQRSDSKRVDVRADVYSIGATLYKLVTDRNVADLFLAEHDASLLEGVPDSLAPVLLKATAYRPEDRYPGVAELARALYQARKQLDDVPDDTPSLVVPPSECPADELSPADPSQPTFPEIAELLETTPAPAPQQPDSSDRPILPYVMPTRQERRASDSADDLPSYIDQADAAAIAEAGRAYRIELQEAERGATAPAAPARSEERPGSSEGRQEDEGGLDAAENAADLVGSIVLGGLRVLMKPAQALAIPIGALLLLGTFIVGSSAFTVRGAQQEARHAQAALYGTLESEQQLIEDLVAMGASREALEALYHDFQEAKGEPEKLDASLRYVVALEDQAKQASRAPVPGTSHKARMAEERLGRIRQQIAEYEQAMLAWEHAADSSRGRLAVQLGVAPRP